MSAYDNPTIIQDLYGSKAWAAAAGQVNEALASGLDTMVKNREKQMKDLKSFVISWNSKKNIVFVTHYVVISEVLNTTVSSGAIIVADKNFKVIGTVETN